MRSHFGDTAQWENDEKTDDDDGPLRHRASRRRSSRRDVSYNEDARFHVLGIVRQAYPGVDFVFDEPVTKVRPDRHPLGNERVHAQREG